VKIPYKKYSNDADKKHWNRFYLLRDYSMKYSLFSFCFCRSLDFYLFAASRADDDKHLIQARKLFDKKNMTGARSVSKIFSNQSELETAYGIGSDYLRKALPRAIAYFPKSAE
jgi:hypothetical protein